MKKVRMQYSLLACLVAVFVFAGIVGAAVSFNPKAASDLAVSIGKQRAMGLVGQNDEAKKALEVYNMVSMGNYLGFASSAVCQQEKNACSMAQAFQQYAGYTNYLQNPAGFFSGFMQQEFCTQNQGACSAYQQSMGMYSQVQGTANDPWGTGSSYATAMAMQKLDPGMSAKISQIMLVKNYLEPIFTTEEQQASGSEGTTQAVREITGSAVIDGESAMEEQAAGDDEAKNQIDINAIPSGQRRDCLVGFNLDGTFGDVLNCRTMAEADLSKFFGKRAGSIVLGKGCSIDRSGSKMSIVTEDMGGKAALCTLKIGIPNVGINSYENLMGGEAKGPEGTTIRSGSFVLDKEGMLLHAEFKAAKDAEYVFEGKKYALQKGATAVYDRKEGEEKGNVIFGFEGIESPKIQVFAFAKGGWEKAPSAVIIPASLAPVKVELQRDGLYKVSGKFTATGLKDFMIGESSDATAEGVNVKTTSKPVHFTSCGKVGKGEWIDYCKDKAARFYQAQGEGFAFTDTLGTGRYYYMKGGGESMPRVASIMTAFPSGKKAIDAVTRGNVEYSDGTGYVASHNGVLEKSMYWAMDESGISDKEKLAKEIEALGAFGTQKALLCKKMNVACPDSFKDMQLPGGGVEGTTVHCMDDACRKAVVATHSEDSTCYAISAAEDSSITGKAVAGITGMAEKDYMAGQQEAKDLIQQKAGGCGVKSNSPFAPVVPKVEITGIYGLRDLTINGVDVEDVWYDENEHKMILRLKGNERVRYYVDPETGQLYTKSVLEGYAPIAGASLTEGQLDFARGLLSSEEKDKIESIEATAAREISMGSGDITISPSECGLFGGSLCMKDSITNKVEDVDEGNAVFSNGMVAVNLEASSLSVNPCTGEMFAFYGKPNQKPIGRMDRNSLGLLMGIDSVEDAYNSYANNVPAHSDRLYASPDSEDASFALALGGGYRCTGGACSGGETYKRCMETEQNTCRVFYILLEQECPPGSVPTK